LHDEYACVGPRIRNFSATADLGQRLF